MISPTLQIRSQLDCPNCWSALDPAGLLWVSAHPDLRGDAFLGDDAQRRFLPSRFDTDGFALDANGLRCQTLACPQCHLTVPRILVDLKPLFLSVVGAPRSGKSYFLASTIWEARLRLSQLQVLFTDADPVANQILSDYEKKLFLTDRPDQFVAIPKTELDGDLYQQVNYGSRVELYARPFIFSLRPSDQHPLSINEPGSERKFSRALCLYDNAGEHFLPNLASELSPATDHLALSEALLFVFDPLQHPRFRTACRKFSSDPQLGDSVFHRQDEVLLEAAKRIRQKANLPQHQQLTKPLVVVVNKFDVWRNFIPDLILEKLQPYAQTRQGVTGINDTLVRQVSDMIRNLLSQTSPEIIAACESFSNNVTYIPVSPQGCEAELNISADQEVASLGVRPENLKPIWAEVPLLYAISKANCALIPSVVKSS